MKRKLSLVLCLVLLAGVLAACGDKDDPSAQENEQPINLLTGEKAADDYDPATRPVAVMINNIRGALPQRGITDADILYEMVTEGGITRLMALYSDPAKTPEVGPVRSARDQHIQMMFPLEANYVYIGGSTYAENMLEQYHYQNRSLDGKTQTGFLRFDEERASTRADAHCWYTSGELIQKGFADYGIDTTATEQRPAFDFVPYDQEPRALAGGKANGLTVQFSGYDSTVFNYQDGKYYKSQFGEEQIDENNGQTLAFDNLLILFTTINPYPDGVLSHVDLHFGGVGYYLSGGRYEKIRWLKGSPEHMLRIVTTDGTETDVKINPGKTYVAVVSLSEFEGCQITSDGSVVVDDFQSDSTLGVEAD